MPERAAIGAVDDLSAATASKIPRGAQPRRFQDAILRLL
jgi:hypothetical protein